MLWRKVRLIRYSLGFQSDFFFGFTTGVESGGHGAGYALPLLNLLPLILAASPTDSPPVLAAGGLANGGHVAAVLTLGASGAVLGSLEPDHLIQILDYVP